jgi:hypothetical protein
MADRPVPVLALSRFFMHAVSDGDGKFSARMSAEHEFLW